MDHRASVRERAIEAIWGWLACYLPIAERHVRSFEDDARHYGTLNRRPLGVRPVPLSRIVGSVGRAKTLGPDFRPARHWLRRSGRYRRIYEAMRRGESLPPVELYKLGYHYYVLDGNHRVAAMKALTHNDGEIDAQVTLFLPVGDTEAARVFLERREFEQATGLQHVGAAERGHYAVLRGEIEQYGRTLAPAGAAPPDLREAAADWHVHVWLPRAHLIRRRLHRYWPEKRSADIYCYVLDHQANESARRGVAIGWDEALSSFEQCCRGDRARPAPRPPFWRRLLHRSADAPPRTLRPPDDRHDPEHEAGALPVG